MTARKSGLGRGLDSLIPDNKKPAKPQKTAAKVPAKASAAKKTAAKAPAAKKSADKSTAPAAKTQEKDPLGQVINVKITKVEPDRNQPRKNFNKDSLAELADSIKRYGVIQPLLVQKKDDHYEIIAGERRWRAAKIAGMKEIPVILAEYDDIKKTEISLIENLQRENLNPIEEAGAYARLINDFDLKQEEVALRVSKSRSAVTNSLRLLKLAPAVQEMLVSGELSEGHARTLLSLPDDKAQEDVAKKIIKEKLSVRETERIVKMLIDPPKRKAKAVSDDVTDLIYRDIEERIKSALGTKVNINKKSKNKGKIEIEYYSQKELERITDLLMSVK